MTDTFKCFEVNCDGIVRKATIKYKAELSNGDVITIDNLLAERCDRCGEILFDSAACETVESAIKAKYPDYYKKWEKKNESSK